MSEAAPVRSHRRDAVQVQLFLPSVFPAAEGPSRLTPSGQPLQPDEPPVAAASRTARLMAPTGCDGSTQSPRGRAAQKAATVLLPTIARAAQRAATVSGSAGGLPHAPTPWAAHMAATASGTAGSVHPPTFARSAQRAATVSGGAGGLLLPPTHRAASAVRSISKSSSPSAGSKNSVGSSSRPCTQQGRTAAVDWSSEEREAQDEPVPPLTPLAQACLQQLAEEDKAQQEERMRKRTATSDALDAEFELPLDALMDETEVRCQVALSRVIVLDDSGLLEGKHQSRLGEIPAADSQEVHAAQGDEDVVGFCKTDCDKEFAQAVGRVREKLLAAHSVLESCAATGQ